MSSQLPPTSYKTISPIALWYNGAGTTASVFQLQCNNDNLSSSANFNYNMYALNADGYMTANVAHGSLNMSGADYAAWQTNDQAFAWAATQLNLTITGDYVQPSPPMPPMPPPPSMP